VCRRGVCGWVNPGHDVEHGDENRDHRPAHSNAATQRIHRYSV
jgi:hypothetical protein